MSSFSEQLILARKAAGLTQQQLAQQLVQTARRRAEAAGRPDDITAAVLKLERAGE